MYDQEESFWFNHVLLGHYDIQFQTKSYFQLSISISTSDFLRFSQAFLLFSLSNNIENVRRSYTLNIHNCLDLIKAFHQVINSSEKAFTEKFQIIRKYNKDKSLIFSFLEKSDTKEKLIKIQIFHNESNFGSIIIDYQMFQTIAIEIKAFASDYIKIGGDIRRDFISSRLLQINDKLLKDIRNLPNQLIEQNPQSDTLNPKPDLIRKEEIPSTTENELHDFIGGDEMINIDLQVDTDIPKIKENLVVYESEFINKVIKRDLSKLESFLNSIINTTNNPMENITNELQIMGMVLLPDISEKDFKSLIYISTLFFRYHHQNYLENGTSFPLTNSIMKYNPKDTSKVKQFNINLAYDLLVIMGYLKCFRDKVESKEADVFINRSLIYLSFRCFFDAFIFSFLTPTYIKIDTIQTIVQSRFKYFESLGVFDFYKKELEGIICDDITENEIHDFAQQVILGPIKESSCIDELHLSSSKQLKLPPDNNFSIEQIINDIIPIEVNEMLGKNIDESLINKSDEIRKIFGKIKKKTSNKKSNLLVYILKYIKDDTELFKEIEKIYNDNEKFNFAELSSELEEIDENIIKALFLWEPKDDIKIKQNYKYFTNKIDQEVMTKELIIAKLRIKTDANDDWNLDGLI